MTSHGGAWGAPPYCDCAIRNSRRASARSLLVGVTILFLHTCPFRSAPSYGSPSGTSGFPEQRAYIMAQATQCSHFITVVIPANASPPIHQGETCAIEQGRMRGPVMRQRHVRRDHPLYQRRQGWEQYRTACVLRAWLDVTTTGS